MLLAIDIGNSNIKFGLYDGAVWIDTWRVQTVPDRTADEYGVLLRSFMRERDCVPRDIDRAVVSSVVPQLTERFTGMVSGLTGHVPLLVRPPQTALGLELAIDHPDTIGADLVAAAVAAYDRFQGNCIAVGLGTATTFVAVEAPGVLR
ncbi:MAG: type III pantothenate kinase, partial [Anaerolineae bacterium]|nr:type III pantothenate kinase [Anaerolineae bacterium]